MEKILDIWDDFIIIVYNPWHKLISRLVQSCSRFKSKGCKLYIYIYIYICWLFSVKLVLSHIRKQEDKNTFKNLI